MGDSNHPVLYTQYDDKGTSSTADDEVAFRVRIGNPSSQTDFKGQVLIAMDANADGKLDLFVGYDGTGGNANAHGIRIYAPGTGLNISPSTTSISVPSTGPKFYVKSSSNSGVVAVSSTSDPAGASLATIGAPTGATVNDLNADSKNDIFISFLLPFTDLATQMLSLSSVTITPDSAMSYVLITMTQNNSINGDIGGCTKAEANSSTTYTSLGAISPALSANNLPPEISTISDQSITSGTSTSALSFTISDPETAAASLTVSGSSSNTLLVPNSNIVFGGSGGSRTVTVTPASNLVGSATITITVSDGSLSASTSFTVTVIVAGSSPPTITSSTTANGTYKSAFSYTITGSETPTSFGATGLPSGLSVNTVTGVISGSPTQSGTFSVTISATNANGTGSATLTLTIATVPLTVTGITASNKVYDRTTAAALNTGSAALVGVISGDTVNLNTGSATGVFADAAIGTGKTVTISGLTISGTHAANYTLTQPTTTANITAKGLTVSGITAGNKVYDRTTTATLSLGSATLVGVISGDLVSLSTGSAAGAFADKTVAAGKTVTISGLTISGTDSGNYTVTQPTTTATITAKGLTVTGITASDKVYDGATTATLNTGSAALVGVVSGDAVSPATGSAVGAFGDSAVGSGKTVTISGVALSGDDAANYSVSQPTATASITARGLTVTGITASNKVYDRTTAAALNTGSAALVGVVSGDSVNLNTASATGVFADAAIGTGKTVTISGLTIKGKDTANYTLTQPTTTANITAKGLTVSGITAGNKVYDRTTTATLSLGSATLVGVISGDSVSLSTGSAAGVFADKTVAAGKTVTISGLTISGTDSGNYTVTQPTTTATITAKGLTVTGITASDKVYDGATTATLNTGSAALVGVVSGDVVSPATGSAVGAFGDSAVGSGKTVTISGVALSGDDAANYSVSQPTTTASITARGLTVTGITASNKVYDRTTAAALNAGSAALVGVVSGGTVNLDTGSATGVFADAAIGTGKTVTISGLTIKGKDAANYTLAQPTTTANITAKGLTVSGIMASDKVYDRTTTATLSLGSATLEGVISGDSVSLSTGSAAGAFADKTVAAGKTVTISGLTISGTDSGNYTVTQPTTTATITAVALTGSITASNKSYDGTTGATIASRTLVGVLDSDVVTLAGGTASFADKGVGTGKTVTATGLSLSGDDAGNYTVNTTATTTANIAAAALSISAVTETKVYDGTTASAQTPLITAGVLAAGESATLSQTFDSKHSGTGKTITPAVVIRDGGASDVTSNYAVTFSAISTGTITARALAISVSGGSKNYDGLTSTTVSLATDKLNGDDVTAGYRSAVFGTKHVGSGKTVSVSGIALSGGDAGNYTLSATTASTTADISTRAITVRAVADSKVYDRSAGSVGGPTLTSGTLAVGDSAAFTQTFDTVSVGTGKTLTPAGNVNDGNDGANYLVTFAEVASGTITAKGLTVSGVMANDKVYDGTTTATLSVGSAALVGVISGDGVTLGTASASAVFANANAGNGKLVTVSGMTLGGADAGNYSLSQPVLTANITAATATVTLGNLLQIYDGSPKSITTATSPAGLAVDVTYDGSAEAPSGAGSYSVVATINNANYQGSANGTLFIVPAVSGVTGPASGHYRAGQTLDFNVTYSGTVVVGTADGTPRMALTIGSTTRYATYLSGSGSSTLVFRHTVQAGDTDNNGISCASPIELNGGTIRDAGGNDAALTFSPPTTTGVIVDTTAPAMTVSGPSSSITKNGPVTFTISYSDANFNSSSLTASQVGLNATGTATGTINVTGSGTEFTVSLSGITGDGTLGIFIAAGTAVDLAGNTAASFGASATFIADNTAPGISMSNPSTSFTTAGPVNYTVTYSDANFSSSTLTPSQVTLNRNGTANGTVSVTGNGTSYTVTISSITGEGSLGISLGAGTAVDLAGNSANATAASATFTVDNTAPTLTVSAPSASITRNGPVTYTLTYADANFNSSAMTVSDVTVNATGTAAAGGVAVTGGGTSYTVTLSSMSGDGTLGITVASGKADDRSGNSAPAATSGTFTVDNTPLTVAIGPPSSSFARGGPASYTVTYSDVNFSASTLKSADVILHATGTASGTVAVSGSGSTRTVTITSIEGNGTLGISLLAETARDLAGNLAPEAGPSTVFTVDNTAPVVAISGPSATIASGGPITYTVTYTDSNFSESTLATAQVTLNSTGTAGGSLSVSGTGTTRTVTLSNLSGNGTLGISLAAGTAVDLAGNSAPAPAASSTFIVDNTAPLIAVSSPSASMTQVGPVTFTVTYSDTHFSSSSLTAAKITLLRNGTANATVAVAGSGASYTVTLASVSGDGTLGISIAAGTALDSAGNTAGALAGSSTVTVDNTLPTLSIGAPSGAITRAGPITFGITYADANLDAAVLTASDLALVATGTAVGTLELSGSGPTYTATVSGIMGNGTIGISVAEGKASDRAGNLALGGASALFTVDNTLPVASISAPSSPFTKTGPVTFTVTYVDDNFDASTLAASDVVLNATGTAVALVTVSGTGSTRTVTLSSISGDGTLGISIGAGSAADQAGNLVAALGPSATFTVDNMVPSIVVGAPSAAITRAGPVTYLVTYADGNFNASTLAAGNISLNATGSANGTVSVTGSGTTRTVTLLNITGNGTLGISIAAGTATDSAGNAAPASSASTVFTVDNTAPAISVSAPSSSFARGGPVTYAVTYADANFNASTLTAAQVTLNRSGTANGTVSVSGSGTSYTVAISSITGNGALGISIAGGSASDMAGNLAGGSTASAAFTVDNIAPVLSIGAPSEQITKGGPITYSITYSDANFDLSTLATGDLVLNATGTAVGTISLAGSGTAYLATISGISGNGTLGLTVPAGKAVDRAGNLVLAGTSGTFVVDNAAPSVAISDPSATVTANGPVVYTISYADANFSASTLAAGAVTLNSTGTAAGTISVSGSGTTRYVSVSNTTGNGTLGISLASGSAVDLAGNLAPAAGPSAVFTVDQSLPSVAISAPSAGVTTGGPIHYSVVFSDAGDPNFLVGPFAASQVVLNSTGTATGTVSVSGSGNTRTVTLSSITGDGTLGISVVSGVATNASGYLSAPGGPSAAVIVDNSAPAIVLGAPSSSFVQGGPVNYTVQYSDANFSASTLTIADISLNRTGTANGTVGVSGSGTNYTVTISSIVGDGALGISIGSGTATDLAGSSAGASGASATFVVDNIVPAISISAASASITRSGPISYAVEYSDANFSASTLSAADVTLNTTGSATGIVSVTGSGTSYTVVVSGITGDGTLGIGVAAGKASDQAGNTAPSANSGTFIVDNTAPTITIGAPSVTITANGPVTYAVTYADANFDSSTLGASIVSLIRNGTADGSVEVTGSGTVFEVAVIGISGDGTLAFSIAAGSAADRAGNVAAVAISQSHIVDHTAPAISISAPSAAITAAGPVSYTLSYSDLNFNPSTLTAEQVRVRTTGTAAGIVSVSGTGTDRVVTFSAITGDGTLGIQVPSGTSTDLAGNPAPAAGPSASFKVDNTAPSVAISAPSVSATTAGPVSYTVTYTDLNFGSSTLAASDITLQRTGTAVGTVAVSGTGTTRTVTISAISGDGTLGLSVGAGTASDLAGNSAPASSASATVTVDNVAPTVTISSPSASYASTGPITYSVTYVDANLSASTLSVADVTLNRTGSANGSVNVSGSGSTYTVTVSGVTGTGTLGISLAGGTATDSSGNLALASGPSAVFIVDNTVPAIAIGAPSSSITASGPVTLAVTYSDANFSSSTLTAADVSLNRNGTANGSVAVSGSGGSFLVTVSSITGEGTLGVSIGAGTATDLAGNTALASAASGTFLVDNTRPVMVVSGPSRTITGSASVSYGVTYSDLNFQGSTLQVTDITLLKSGTANGTVSVSGGGTSYTVTIGSVSGDGSLAIAIAAGTATDQVGNAAVALVTSATFTVDNTVPAVVLSGASASFATGGPVAYTATYSDANFSNSTLAASDVTLHSTGTATGSVAVSGTGATRTVTISGISGEGTLGISLAAGTAADLAGNLAGAAGPSAAFTVDNTAPAVTISAPSVGVTQAGPVSYTVTYSDANGATSTLTAADVTLNATGTAVGSLSVSGSGNTRTITLSGISGDGTLGISLAAATGSDPAGNSAGAPSASATFKVDNTAPVVALSGPSAAMTRGGPVTYSIACNDLNFASSTLSLADIVLNRNGSANGTVGLAGSGTSYTVTISDVTGDGSLGISLRSGTVLDQAGNSAGPAGPSATFTVDNTTPAVAISAPSASFATTGTVTYTITLSDLNFGSSALTPAQITLNKTGTANGVVAVAGSGTSYVVSISSLVGDGVLGISIGSGVALDLAGNTSPAAGPSGTFTVDNTAPAVAISAPSRLHTVASPVTFTISYSDLNFNSSTLTTAHIALNKTGSANGAVSVSGSGGSRTVTISSISGNGTLGISIASGTAADLAGNSAAAAGPSATFTVDNTIPAISISEPSSAHATTGPVTYTVSYADSNFGASTLTAADIVLDTTGTAGGVVSVSGSGSTRLITISNLIGDGMIGLSLNAGTASDLAGNLAPAAGPSASFTVDNTAPQVAISRPSSDFATQGPVTYTVTFSDANFGTSGLTADQVTLNRTGSANGTLSVVGSGTSYTVSISALTGDGALGISVGGGAGVDRAGNLARAAGPSDLVTVDNTLPSISIGGPSRTFSISSPVTYTVTYADSNFEASTLNAGQITLNKTGTAMGVVTVSGSGTTRTVTLSGLTGNGTLGISVLSGTATDSAGNSAPGAGPSAVFTVDNVSPSVTISGPSMSHAAAGPVTYTVSYADSNFSAATLTAANVILNTTGTAAAVVSVAGTGNLRTVTLSNLVGDGTMGISLESGSAADLAGNTAQGAGPSVPFIVDNTRPAVSLGPPSAVVTASGPVTYTVDYHDANFSASTLTASDISLVTTGTAAAAVNVSGTGLTRLITLSDISGDGTLSVLLDAGTANDLAGNQSAGAGPSLTLGVDNTPPQAPSAPVLAAGEDSGRSTSDQLTNIKAPRFVGTAEANVTVELFKDGTVSLGSTLADAQGNWVMAVGPLMDGSHRVSARAIDAAGHVSPESGTVVVSVDTVAPVTPGLPDLLTESDSGSSNSDDITSDSAPSMSGLAEADATVEVFRGGAISLGNTTADLSGLWVLTAPSLADGVHSITAIATDAAGNSSNPSAALAVTVDSSVPFISPIEDQTVDEDRTATGLVFLVNDQGTAAERLLVRSGSTDQLLVPAANLIVEGTGENRTVTVQPVSQLHGSTRVVLTVTDPAGNSAETGFNLTVVPRNDAPTLGGLADLTLEEDAGEQLVALGGISAGPLNESQTLLISASSSNPSLIADPTIEYTSPSSSGLLKFTPLPNANGTAILTVMVVDNGVGVGGETNTFSVSFNVTVTPVNDAPSLEVIAAESVDEETVFRFATKATDIDSVPADFGFSLDPGAPTGMTIDSASGVIEWIPSEAQGPGSYTVMVRVTDHGTPPLEAVQTFDVSVREVNSAPVLAVQNDRITTEGGELVFQVTGTDRDIPANTLTYRLNANAPAGAEIDPASGRFSWRPSETQGPGNFPMVVEVFDNGDPALSASRSFSVVVDELNEPPILASIAAQTIEELKEFVFRLEARDADLPAQTLRFALGSGAPAGATLDPSTGVFRWTPGEHQGPGVYVIEVQATDSDGSGLAVSTSFNISVIESNSQPVLGAVAPQSVAEGSELSLTIPAVDGDAPADGLAFRLGPAAPAGASVDPVTGRFSWTPAEAHGPGVYPIEVSVTDNGLPALSDTMVFEVRVHEVNSAPILPPLSEQNVNEGEAMTVAISATDPDEPAGTLVYSLGGGAPAGMTISADSGLLSWKAPPLLADTVYSVNVTARDDGNPSLSATRTLRIVARGVNDAPSISMISGQSTEDGVETAPIAFRVTDPETPSEQLSVSGRSSNPGLIRDQDIQFAGTGENRTLTIKPFPGRFGRAVITLSVTDANGLTGAREFEVEVVPVAPVILTERNERKVRSETPVEMIVQARGTEPLTYEWLFNGNVIPGAVQPALTITQAQPVDAGIYSVRVRNQVGSATGEILALAVESDLALPIIVKQPQGQPVLLGGGAQLTVSATGEAPLEYQWQLNGRDLPGETTEVLSIANATTATAGRYRVRVSNRAGTILSDEAELEVSSLAQVSLSVPAELIVGNGEPTVVQAVVTGHGPFTYQWYFDGQLVPGATHSSLTFAPVRTIHDGRYRVVVRNAAGSVASPETRLTVIQSLAITEQPQNQIVKRGENAQFTVGVSGTGPFLYSWEFNGEKFRDTSSGTLVLPGVSLGVAGTYRVHVQGAAGSVRSESATLTVLGPPSVRPLPSLIRTNQSADVVLTASAEGLPPFRYQWIRNGVNIPGATEDTYIIRNIQPEDGGNYSVVVTDAGGAITSNTCQVMVVTPPIASGDNLAQASLSTATEGTFSGSNVRATREQNEPNHAPGKPARKSVWFGWKAPGDGIMELDTAGSSFDTIVAVYRGRQDDITSLEQVASDGDSDSGSYLTSKIGFNTEAGTTYFFAVDGFEGVEGSFVVRWKWEETADKLPLIVQQPVSQTVLLGQDVAFSAAAISPDGKTPAYQWYFDGELISGATGPVLFLRGVQDANVGNYRVKVRNGIGAAREAESQDAILQINIIETGLEGPGIEAIDKIGASSRLGDQVIVQSLGLASHSSGEAGAVLRGRTRSSVRRAEGQLLSVAPDIAELRGYRGSKVFSTKTAARDAGEPNHCHLTGGASVWFTYNAVTNGVMRFTTEGSDYDTVLAVYTGPDSSYDSMEELVCDNDSGADGKTSVVQFDTVPGTTYYLAIDGVNGASGLVRFKYEVAAPPVLPGAPTWQKVDPANCVVVDAAINPQVGPDDSIQFLVIGTNSLAPVELTYQWRRNGLNLESEAGSTLCLKRLTARDIGEYSVVVGNFSGSVTSAPVRLNVSQPIVLLEPLAGQKVVVGETARFGVLVDGMGPFDYQWAYNGTILDGQNGSELILPNAQVSQAGQYSVVISNGIETLRDQASLTVEEPAAIVVQPASQTAPAGSSVELTVVASGTAPLSYQWFHNGSLVAGATAARMTIAALRPETAGSYRVVVGNSVRSAVSDTAFVAVEVAPPELVRVRILEQPTDKAIRLGESVAFSVGVEGTAPLRFQWMFNGEPIAGATNSLYAMSKTQLNRQGRYSVVVSNALGSVKSREAGLCVLESETAVRFMSINVLPNQAASRVVICGCSGTEAILQGTTGFQMWSVLTNLTFRADNTYEFLDLEIADKPWRQYQVAPILPVRITGHPKDKAIPEGTNARLEVSVEGTGPFAYQWRFNGVPMAGATNSVLVLTNVSVLAQGQYDVRVTNRLGRVVSQPAQLCVLNSEHAVEIVSVRLLENRTVCRVLICGPVVDQAGRLYGSFDGEVWTLLTPFTIGPEYFCEYLDRQAVDNSWRYYKVMP